MAAETEPGELAAGRELLVRRLKGRLFEGVLVVATLIGVLSLVALISLIAIDALGIYATEPAWYLLYLAVLVAPMSGYTLYVRRRPATATVNDRAFAVTCGGLAGSLVVYMVANALEPTDVAVFFSFAALPPIAVVSYARRYGGNNLTGPAVPASIALGLGAAFLLDGPLGVVLDPLRDWILYFVFFVVPVAAAASAVAGRRWEQRNRRWAGGAVVASGLAGIAVSLLGGLDAELAVVLAAGAVAPVGLVVVDTFENDPDGRVGLLGPVVLVGGILAGAALERRLGVVGPDSWLTPTLVLESWSNFRAEQAGVYPQLVGSILLVGLMIVLAFPVGVGAAIYLEEYAPASGWRGRLASALDVNISNLAGVPSVVYGLLGLALFQQVFGLQPGIVIAGSVTLGLLILPIVIVAAQEALRSVPDEYRQGSYGMGASRWQTVRNVVLPEAVPGILTGTILAVGRAIGETAPLVMIGLATTNYSVPSGIFSAASALPLQIFASRANTEPEFRVGVLAAASIVLLLLLLTMNATAIIIRNRYQRDS